MSGDGLRMATAVDAALGNTTEGWWMPAMHVPGEEVDGVTHYRPLHGERAQPGAIMVDRTGRRFVDEAQNYGDVGRAMRARLRPGAGRGAYPGRAVLVGVRRRVPPPLPGGPARARRRPTRPGWSAPTTSTSWP